MASVSGGPRGSGLGQQGGSEREQQGHGGQRQQEDRPPPVPFEEQPGDHGRDEPADGERGGPDAEGDAAPATVREQHADQRERRRHEGRSRDALAGTRGHERRCGRGERRGRRRGGEGGGSPQEEATAAEPIRQCAHHEQRSGQEEAVAVDDPQLLRGGRADLCRELRQGEVEHVPVHGDQQTGEDEHGEPGPGAGLHPGRRLGDGHRASDPGRLRRDLDVTQSGQF